VSVKGHNNSTPCVSESAGLSRAVTKTVGKVNSMNGAQAHRMAVSCISKVKETFFVLFCAFLCLCAFFLLVCFSPDWSVQPKSKKKQRKAKKQKKQEKAGKDNKHAGLFYRIQSR
jgi:hypothetical protein